MRKLMFGVSSAFAMVGLVACGSSSTPAGKSPVSVAGCIKKVDDAYMLVPNSRASGPVGTSGRRRWELKDDANVGIARYVDRETSITGRPGSARPDGTTVLHVTGMTGGGECGTK